MNKRLLSVVIAVAMVFTFAMPSYALRAQTDERALRYETPAGYNDHDYQTAVAFLETVDDSGASNIDKLRQLYSEVGLTFDLADPSTWGRIEAEVEEEGFLWFYGFIWTAGSEKRLRGIYVEFEGDGAAGVNPPCGSMELYGCEALEIVNLLGFELDAIDASDCPALKSFSSQCRSVGSIELAGCGELKSLNLGYEGLTELDITGCAKLEYLQCAGESLTEIDLSGFTLLKWINFSGTPLESLDVSACAELETLMCSYTSIGALSVAGLSSLDYLDCSNCPLESLDVSGCASLNDLYCDNTKLKVIDLSTCPGLALDSVTAEGDGFVGVRLGAYAGQGSACAIPANGAEFLGWYSEDGALISESAQLGLGDIDRTTLIARFTDTPAVNGDANNDGTVTAEDALLVLRHSMGIMQLSDEALENSDFNNDGSVDGSDALLILRFVMGSD